MYPLHAPAGFSVDIQLRSFESQRSHPLQIAFRVRVQAVLPGYRRDLLTPHLDLRDIVIADADLLAILQVARPAGIDAHGLDSYTIGGTTYQYPNAMANFQMGFLSSFSQGNFEW